ncbi:MAG: class I tRNA ligase family protein, partial [Candidatus Woesearchaeota archaeon]|nr:class I tRNA ligase family protein [Candidatus Woesearchaeota archaeon]
IWILAKGLATLFIQGLLGKNFKVLEEFKGSKLKGLKYIHPFSNEIHDYKKLEKISNKIHTVVLSSEYVDLSAGSGLVHMAPGCGPEDYEIGYREGIPPYNNLDEQGIFPSSMGKFSKLRAKKDDKKFIEALKEKGALITTSVIEHDYAHCWRCKNPVIFRTTKQWFFKIEDLKPEMRKFNKKIFWIPDYAGSRQFDSWIANLRDNGITRQRYWGTPLPIWKCKKCNDYIVIGSIAELKKLAGKLPIDLHKPWIDEIKIPCKKCGSIKERIPDVLDVWIDAGSASWNCINYPQDTTLFKKMFPADFILEGIDQIRGWFNMLYVDSMIALKKPSFKAVYMHGFIQDSLGRKMSKSLGNYILPEEVISQYGADTLRYYTISATNPGLDLNYNFDDMKTKHKNLIILWNLHEFLIQQSKFLNINPSKLKINKFDLEEKYILSKLNSTIQKVTYLFEHYRLNEIPLVIEELYLDLSRTYIQLIREKISSGSEQDKKTVLYTIYKVLIESLTLFSTVSPFITEKIYQNIKNEFKLKEESIHLFKWPKENSKLINKKLEQAVSISNSTIKEILAQREKVQLGIRWPLPEVTITSKHSKDLKLVIPLIKTQTNVKKIILKEGNLKIELNTNITKELEQEGFVRELTRRIQSLRKQNNLVKSDRIDLSIVSSYSLEKWKKEIQNKVNARSLDFKEIKHPIYSKEKIKNQEFDVYFRKL